MKGWSSIALPHGHVVALQRFSARCPNHIWSNCSTEQPEHVGLGSQSRWLPIVGGMPAGSSPCGLSDNITPGWLRRRQGKGSDHELIVAL